MNCLHRHQAIPSLRWHNCFWWDLFITERLFQKSKWGAYTVLGGSLSASQNTGQRGYFLDQWIKTKTDMEREGAVHIFERTAAPFWINHIYIYTDILGGFKIDAQDCTLHIKKAKELKSKCLQQTSLIRRKGNLFRVLPSKPLFL